MKVPFIDLRREYKFFKKEIDSAIKRVIENGNFILGDEVKAFEKEWSNYLGIKHTITVASGTDALFLALKALDIGKGDEVILPSYTFISTAFTVTNTGAKPIFVDSQEDSPLIDVNKILGKITKRTKAIIPVHMFGQPAYIEDIMKISKENKIHVIEDASQAHGAEYKNKKVGTFGDIGCFSFYPTKNLGAYGDCGAIVTRSDKIAEKLFSLRNYGQLRKYFFSRFGYNSRMDEIQAAILRAKLKHLDALNNGRRKVADRYDEEFEGKLKILKKNNQAKSVYHIYPIFNKKRNDLRNYLENNGIPTLIHYPFPIHLQEAYGNLLINRKHLYNSEAFASKELSLPIGPFMKDSEIEFVIKNVNNFFLRKEYSQVIIEQ